MGFAREPSVADALERTYEAGQSLLLQRIDLLVAETRVHLRNGRALAVGAIVAIAGWLYLMQGTIDGLAQRYPRYAVELAVGALHVGAALLFVLRGRQALPKPEVGR